MSMLIKGLKYIIPCQHRFSRQSTEEIAEKQYKNISATVKTCLEDHGISTVDQPAKQAFQELKTLLHNLYSKPLARSLALRAKREYKTIQSIQQLLCQRPDIVIRRTDKSKVFYIGKVSDFEQKTEEYMLKTKAYEEIIHGRSPLGDNLRAVRNLLNYFVTTKALTSQQRSKLSPKLNKLELGHFHALPKPHKLGTPIRPIIACINASTTLISQCLNDLLAPIYLSVACATTFTNSIDVTRKLEKHAADGHITTTTNFIISDVENLYTMITREGAPAALSRFCLKHSINKRIGTFTVDHIMKMARLILDTNSFAYNDRYYKQIRGGAMGSAFTQVLANIYMLEWEQYLIAYQASKNEIYGRYIDDIFMTTNESIDEMKNILDRANDKDVNIKINYQIGKSIDFLDITIHNEDGRLRTCLYHKPSAEPYILPYSSDHPRHISRNIPYAALLRAARICSDVNDFHAECIRIDMSLLLNEYPPSFSRKQFYHFFHCNNAMNVLTALNENGYRHLHQKSLYQPTRREKQLTVVLKDAVLSPAVLKAKIWDKTIMYPRYQFDASNCKTLSVQFYKWWNIYYKNEKASVRTVKIRLVANTNETVESYLVHKKPPKERLTRMENDGHNR
ncbi:unnamed protein product [Rotaria magnacalcarata]|uniref:Reverse transcriptase domain-containing protein n=3 Tax=Rotaria magnacalcarata TaxID=392030 RepID=A0A815AF71_9BILA|nr:unnamed protein product [Rotaria magnacalcarata]